MKLSDLPLVEKKLVFRIYDLEGDLYERFCSRKGPFSSIVYKTLDLCLSCGLGPKYLQKDYLYFVPPWVDELKERRVAKDLKSQGYAG